MSTDPTNYHRPIEPTQPAHYNPYETTSPYDEIPIPPPPPPSPAHRMRWIVLAICVVALLSLLGGVLFAALHAGIGQPAVRATPAPTVATTMTSAQSPPRYKQEFLQGLTPKVTYASRRGSR
jgi:hypothetical protein